MIKHYISSIPMLPAGSLKPSIYKYETKEGTAVHDRAISFPVLVSLDKSLKKGDDFRITVIEPKHDNVPGNFERFKAELMQILKDKEIEYDTDSINEIVIEYSEDDEVHFELFEQLISCIKDEEKLYTCITYGSKPMPLIMLMSLNYVYSFCKNTFIESIVYGQYNHLTGAAMLYDVSSLFYMNSAVNNISLLNIDDPLGYIKKIISE